MICQAWQQQDVDRAKTLLTDRLNRSLSAEVLNDVIVGPANQKHSAFEILPGKKIGEDRYEFEVRLFYRYSGTHGDKIETPLDKIIISREPSEVLRVDQFPRLRPQQTLPRHVTLPAVEN